jgi:hypothetical protein
VISVDLDETGGSRSIGAHSSDVIAFNIDEACRGSDTCSPDSVTLVTADYNGTIKIWNLLRCIQEIRIRDLEDLTPKYRSILYFSMEYPYYISIYGKYIAFSSDHGVLVIKPYGVESTEQKYTFC